METREPTKKEEKRKSLLLSHLTGPSVAGNSRTARQTRHIIQASHCAHIPWSKFKKYLLN
jgi:hypothetical protein